MDGKKLTRSSSEILAKHLRVCRAWFSGLFLLSVLRVSSSLAWPRLHFFLSNQSWKLRNIFSTPVLFLSLPLDDVFRKLVLRCLVCDSMISFMIPTQG